MSIIYRISKRLFELAIRILFKLNFTGREILPKAPFIVAANHTSLLDPPIVGIACNKYLVDFIVKQELFEYPLVGQWTRRIRAIPVKRGDNPIKGMREALRRIKNGHVVGIFPEGTRSTDGNIQEAKMGAAFLMLKSHVPIVPVYVYGTTEAFPKGGKIKRGHHVGCVVGRPIQTEELELKTAAGKTDYAAIANLVMERIRDLKGKTGEKA